MSQELSVPHIEPEKAKRLQINTPMMSMAEAVKVLSHFEFDENSADYSLLLVSHLSEDEVNANNLMLSVAQSFDFGWLKFASLSRLGLYCSLDGAGAANVVDVAKQPSAVPGQEQKAGVFARVRDFIHDKL